MSEPMMPLREPLSPGEAALLRLAPHLLNCPPRGIVGSSRYALKLRDAIRDVSRDPERPPVLISGEPGLGKNNIAALIHFGSASRRQLLIRFNGAELRSDGAELFARSHDDSPSIVESLGTGALLIDQIDRVENPLRQRLVELACSGPCRMFFTAERRVPELDGVARQIRVPPLRVRRQDMGEWLRFLLRRQALVLGWRQAPAVSDAVLKRLQTYDFPNNVEELQTLVDRSMRQCGDEQPALLPDAVVWTGSRQRRTRFDIWRWRPALRDRMRDPRLWNAVLFGLVSWVFVAVNLWLWLGPQDRAHNGALNLFWAWWWPLILLTFPLVGRFWCAVCPFMVWGRIVQVLAQSLGWRPAHWPRGETDRWAAPSLAALFAAILLWEEVSDLPDTAWLSSCLLLLITAGAVVGSLRFEKRFWCRHLCPVGGMNGLFAKLAISELRAEPGICSGSCTSYACFKGGPAEGEGMATEGCPLGTHPAHLSDNRDCVLCLTCAQACPHRSVQLRLRPPAADLQPGMDPPAAEAGLILVLAGGVCLQHWQRLLGWLPLAPATLHQGDLLARLAFAALALALPSALFLLVRSRLLLYGLLPLLWSLMLAHHLPVGMAEAGLLLPVSTGTWWPHLAASLPGWSADSHVIAFAQSLALTTGLLGSAVVMRRLLLPQGWNQWWLGGLLLGLGAGGRWLVAMA